MTRSVVIDDKLDALLAGRETAPGDELAAELSHMLGQLQEAFPPVVVSEQVEDAHLARMMEAAASLPVVETAAMVAPQAPLLGRIRLGLSRRIAVMTLALTTAFGGAAYAGVLPEPIQRAVAEVGATVGLDLPDGDNGADMRLPVPDGDDGGEGDHRTEREPDPGFLGGTDGERLRDGDAVRGGVDSKDRDQRDDSDSDSDPDSDDGEGDREIDHDHESDDDHETDDLSEDNDEEDNDESEKGGGHNGESEGPEAEDSEDSGDEVE